MGFKFVHASDLHLDSPFRGLSLDPRWRSVFGGATLKAFERIVSLCLRERVDFLVIAGDLFDQKDRSVRARLALHRGLSRLDEAGIRTFIVHGNHDPLSADRGGLSLPASVKVFGASWEEALLTDGDGRVYCRIQGISYPQEKVTENLSRRFRRNGAEFTLGLLHANLAGSAGHANYSPCSLADLDSCGLDYWALGHVHTRAVHPLPGGALAVYPGNPQGRHAYEDGERGCVLVEVENRQATARFIGVDAVRWHRLSLDLEGLDTLDALADAAEDRVREWVQAEPGSPEAHAVRLIVAGRGPLHHELAAPEGLCGFEEILAERLAAHHPPVLLESVVDETRSQLDLAQLASAGGLSGAIAGFAREGFDATPLLEEDDLKRLEAILRKQGLPSPRDQLAELTQRAAHQALELLIDEELQ